jgi:multiple sugar transport system substrate-binding protein
MPRSGDTVDSRDRVPFVTRRRFLAAAGGTGSVLLLAACGGSTQAPAAKPTEAAKAPAPAATTAPAAPAAKPAESPAATKPADAAKPAASPAAAAPAVKAPVNLKGTTLSILQWSSFIPDADPFFKKQIEESFMKETGATVNIEFVNANDVQPKTAAAIQSGQGPDIIGLRENWAHIYAENEVDVTDVAEEIKKQVGDFYPGLDAYSKVGGKYLAVPHDQGSNAVHWRKSWFKEIGVEQYPKTYDEWHAAGKKLKANGHPFGQALGHSFGDPPTWCYPFMWAYGGREVDEQGKVAINSPETLAAVRAMKEAWPAAYDETGLAWDDTSNNRAFLAGTISATNNGASAWWVARKDKSPFFDDIALDLMPAGPKGQFLYGGGDYYAIMKYSKNVDAAKEWIRWTMRDDVFMPWFELNGSYVGGVSAKHDAAAPWDKFPPITRVFKEFGPKVRTIGWPGPPNQKAGLAWSKYIIVDMFAKACGGDSAESAVAWAENELKQVYT